MSDWYPIETKETTKQKIDNEMKRIRGRIDEIQKEYPLGNYNDIVLGALTAEIAKLWAVVRTHNEN